MRIVKQGINSCTQITHVEPYNIRVLCSCPLAYQTFSSAQLPQQSLLFLPCPGRIRHRHMHPTQRLSPAHGPVDVDTGWCEVMPDIWMTYRPKLYLQLRSVSPYPYKITIITLPTPSAFSLPTRTTTMAENDRNSIPPAPAYFPTSADSPLHPPTALYTTLRDLPSTSLIKTQDFTIPPRSGKAWTVPAGALFRLSTPEGPQVGDLNVWNQHDPRERFWASRTRQLQGSHVVQGDRLWSCLPFMRPMCGLVEDGCEIRDSEGKGMGKGRESSRDERGGVTRWGGRCNDLLGTRCDPYGMSECAGLGFGLGWAVPLDSSCSFRFFRSNRVCGSYAND